MGGLTRARGARHPPSLNVQLDKRPAPASRRRRARHIPCASSAGDAWRAVPRLPVHLSAHLDVDPSHLPGATATAYLDSILDPCPHPSPVSHSRSVARSRHSCPSYYSDTHLWTAPDAIRATAHHASVYVYLHLHLCTLKPANASEPLVMTRAYRVFSLCCSAVSDSPASALRDFVLVVSYWGFLFVLCASCFELRASYLG